MVQLLHEVWQDENSLELCIASDRMDELRRLTSPNARRVFSFLAGSLDEANRIHYARNGWGEYRPVEGYKADPYTKAMRQRQIDEGRI